MERICAWCKKDMGQVDSPHTSSPHEITHGICDDCKNNISFQKGVTLGVYLNSLEQPVVVVNHSGQIVTANDRAKALLRKEISEIEGHRGGVVFECANSRLPEGCGNTIHCSGCTIRKSVMETHATGKCFLKVPATLKRGTLQHYRRAQLLISTAKIANYVLLRIDKMEENPAPETASLAELNPRRRNDPSEK